MVLENGIETFPHAVSVVTTFTRGVYIFQWGQDETLAAQKLKELQGPKSRSGPLPRDAMLPPNEICFRGLGEMPSNLSPIQVAWWQSLLTDFCS